MPSRLLSGVLPQAVLAGTMFLVCGGYAAESSGTGTPAKQPVDATSPTGAATLRSLAAALKTQDREQAGRLTWRLLAALAHAKEQGMGPSEYLAAGYRAERLGVADSSPVQHCLLEAWASAQSMALFTPENLALMDRGESPRATRGLQRGLPVVFDTGTPPEMTMKMQVGAKDFDPARVTTYSPARAAQPTATAAPVATPPTYQVKTYDVRLNEKLPLDSCGLTNWDLRLDRVDRTTGVSFVLENRLALRADRYPSVSAVNFTPEPIPGTTLQGVKLKDAKFASIYLDENLGAQVSYRIVVRGPREIFMLDQLSPEQRKYYGGYSPP